MAEDPVDKDLKTAPAFTEQNDLISEVVGGKVIFSTDDFFAQTENLMKLEEPIWKEGVFTEFGKWMDGWETRRKRIPGHDWCIIQLGSQGVINGFDVDTSFFTGNFCPRVSIQAACLTSDLPDRTTDNRMGSKATEEDFKKVKHLNSQNWKVIVKKSPLKPGYRTTCHNYFEVNHDEPITHIRVNMYPDGGIARLRAYGRVKRDWSKVPITQMIDLVAESNGGISVGYSDNHYGHPRNMILPGRARVMAEGWETLDRPAILEADSKGFIQISDNGDQKCCEWAEFKLGTPGVVLKIELDTNHFKGNFPDSCFIEACYKPNAEGQANGPWKVLLDAQKLAAHRRHYYEWADVNKVGVITHVKVTIVPDGGISRLRLWGYRAAENMKHKL